MLAFKIKLRTYLILAIALFCYVPIAGQAAEGQITVNPGVLDEVSGVRQTIERKVRIKNNTPTQSELYVIISSLDEASTGKETLANWLQITRGVISLKSGEERELPLKIVLGANVSPGQYHAQIAFVSGANRWDAEENSKKVISTKLIVNLSIEEKIIEKLDNSFFKSARSINIEKTVNFLFHLKNIGNTQQLPKGSINIYNRNGQEVASVAINEQNEILSPEKEKDFMAVWKADNKIGKFKAKLDVAYGRDSAKTISDTYYFWILPKWFLYLLGGIIFLLLLAMFYSFYKMRHHTINSEEDSYNHVIDLRHRAQK